MLKAGWSSIDITPPAGIDLSGFGGREGPNARVHDPLFAKALCVADEQQRIALLTADLVGLDAATVADVRAVVAGRLGPDTPALMIACSHTHSGPATPCLAFIGHPDPTYLASLRERLAEVVCEASTGLSEAQVGYGQGEVLVGINRRERLTDGSTALGRNEAGTVAPYVDVVHFCTEGKQAVLFSHAAHPVTLGGDNLEVSADWPGYAQTFIEESCRGGCLALFAQGCCGNINSDPRGTFEIAEQQGRVVADAVLRLLPTIRAAAAGPVAGASVVLDLPLQDPPSEEQAQAQLAALEAILAAGEGTDNYGARKAKEGVVDWARRILDLARAGQAGLTQPFEVQAFRVGDIALIGLPGEVFVEYQHQIRACSPFAHTLVFAYANGNIGYLPTQEAFPQGGYEVDYAIQYYGDTMLTPDCEALVVGGGCALLADLA